ncbi:MAG TPA: hypothetical protein VMJ12_08785 [Candidatus Acidoferrales bacterium]|nr:hypothetical protein [Candidatus Acidoferrales bacterium]
MPEYNLNEGRSGSPEQSASQKRAGNLSRLTLLLAVVCLIQLGLLAMLVFGRRPESGVHFQPPVTVMPAIATPQEPYLHGHPGPWGDLEYARISLEPPDEFVPADANFFGATHWFFEGYTPATLAAFFGQCGLPPAQLAELTNAAAWSEKTDGVLVLPGDDLVLALDEPARQKIYSVLAKSQENTLHLWPFKSRSDNLENWFGDAGLSDGTLALLKKLVYRRGECLCFSDISVVYPRIARDDERRRLIKRLARTRTLLMKLHVTPNSNVDALADYWAKGRRNKDIVALLDSLTNTPGGMTIDVAHLLPAFARKYLYTFPTPPADLASTKWPDCNWTAFNFFRDQPDDRFYDFDVCGNDLVQNYTKVREATFGDLIVFYRPDGFPIHVVVYIADDIVFTKNGSSTFHPWTLMKWDDLISDYTLDYTPVYVIFHPKWPME